jgi:hypothetical protein
MITSVAAAYYAHAAVRARQRRAARRRGSQAGIQAMYQQPITEAIEKYGKRMSPPNRVHDSRAYAFREVKRPAAGPSAACRSWQIRARLYDGFMRAVDRAWRPRG